MASDAVLQEVAASAAEAEAYERLQQYRQRGIHGLVAGLPGFFAALWLTGVGGPWGLLWVVLVVLSSFTPQLLLPLLRRMRPEWQDPVLDASILKRGMEALFWSQLVLLAAGTLLPPVVLIAAVAMTWDAEVPFAGTTALVVGLQLALQLAATLALAWRARRRRDALMEAGFWVTGAAAVALAAALGAWTTAPSILAFHLLGLTVAGPPLLAAGIRLMAPRRWLVR